VNRKHKIELASFLLLSAGLNLFCQTEKQLVPSDIKLQTLVTEPVTLRKGFLRLGSLANYRVADKRFNDSGSKEYYLSNTWGSKASYNITLQYGINDRLQAEIITEYMINRQEQESTEVVAGTNTTRTIVARQKGFGIGDTYLSLKYQFVPESKYRVSLSGILTATLPTGEKNPTNIISGNQYDLPLGDGTYSVTPGLYARTILYPYSFTMFLNYTWNFSGTKKIDISDVVEKKFRFGNRIEAGLSANIHLNEWIVMANEMYFYREGAGKIDDIVTLRLPESWAASYKPNLVFQVKKFRLGESVTIPLKGKNVPADPLYIMMVQYIF
jgi:hypothetical protein